MYAPYCVPMPFISASSDRSQRCHSDAVLPRRYTHCCRAPAPPSPQPLSGRTTKFHCCIITEAFIKFRPTVRLWAPKRHWPAGKPEHSDVIIFINGRHHNATHFEPLGGATVLNCYQRVALVDCSGVRGLDARQRAGSGQRDLKQKQAVLHSGAHAKIAELYLLTTPMFRALCLAETVCLCFDSVTCSHQCLQCSQLLTLVSSSSYYYNNGRPRLWRTLTWIWTNPCTSSPVTASMT